MVLCFFKLFMEIDKTAERRTVILCQIESGLIVYKFSHTLYGQEQSCRQ